MKFTNEAVARAMANQSLLSGEAIWMEIQDDGRATIRSNYGPKWVDALPSETVECCPVGTAEELLRQGYRPSYIAGSWVRLGSVVAQTTEWVGVTA